MTCVLLRGLTREAAHWGAFPAALSAALGGERVVALDLPGAGACSGERSPTRIDDYVGACRDQARRRGVEPPFDIVALSLGAMVAVAWAQRHVDEIARCVLINTSLRPFAPFFRRLRPSVWPSVLRALMTSDRHTREAIVLALTSSRVDAHGDILARWAGIAGARPVSRANALRQLCAAARFRAPAHVPCGSTLLLASRNDRLVDVRCSRALAAAWSIALYEHAGAGHDLPLDDPEWVVQNVAAWLVSAEKTTAAPARAMP